MLKYPDVPPTLLLALLRRVPSINGGQHGVYVNEAAAQSAVEAWRIARQEKEVKKLERKKAPAPKKERISRRRFVPKDGYIRTTVIAAEFPEIGKTHFGEIFNSVPNQSGGSYGRFVDGEETRAKARAFLEREKK